MLGCDVILLEDRLGGREWKQGGLAIYIVREEYAGCLCKDGSWAAGHNEILL